MKLTDFKNPLTGNKESLSIGTLWSYVLGVVVVLGTIAVGEKAFGKVTGRVPGIGQPSNPFYHPAPPAAPARIKF